MTKIKRKIIIKNSQRSAEINNRTPITIETSPPFQSIYIPPRSPSPHKTTLPFLHKALQHTHRHTQRTKRTFQLNALLQLKPPTSRARQSLKNPPTRDKGLPSNRALSLLLHTHTARVHSLQLFRKPCRASDRS